MTDLNEHGGTVKPAVEPRYMETCHEVSLACTNCDDIADCLGLLGPVRDIGLRLRRWRGDDGRGAGLGHPGGEPGRPGDVERTGRFGQMIDDYIDERLDIALDRMIDEVAG